jgi:hypothetical protein
MLHFLRNLHWLQHQYRHPLLVLRLQSPNHLHFLQFHQDKCYFRFHQKFRYHHLIHPLLLLILCHYHNYLYKTPLHHLHFHNLHLHHPLPPILPHYFLLHLLRLHFHRNFHFLQHLHYRHYNLTSPRLLQMLILRKPRFLLYLLNFHLLHRQRILGMKQPLPLL